MSVKNWPVLVGLLLVSSSAWADRYHVDASGGDDTWDGRAPAHQGGKRGPWRTLARVNDFARSPHFASGDAIALKRGETWADDEPIGWDGGVVSWGTIDGLTIEDYGSGNKPRIDCTTQAAVRFYGFDKVSNLTIRNLDASGMGWPNTDHKQTIYVTGVDTLDIDGIYIDGHRGTTTYNVRSAIAIGTVKGDVTVQNCEIFNIIGKNGRLDGEFAIVINHWLQAVRMKTEGTIRYINNVVHDVAGDILQPTRHRSPDGTIIAGNLFYHFAENAIDLKSCTHVTIENNEIYRDFGGSHKYRRPSDGWTDPEDIWPNTIHDFANIVMHAAGPEGEICEHITVRHNRMHSTGDYRNLATGSTKDLRVYGNHFRDARTLAIGGVSGGLIYNNVWELTNSPSCDPVDCGRFSANAVTVGNYARDVKIFNNTFYVDSDTIRTALYYGVNKGQSGNEIRNNIFFLRSPNAAFFPLYLHVNDKTVPLPLVQNNLYFNPLQSNRVYWSGTKYLQEDEETWRSAGHGGAVFADPHFLHQSPLDLQLASQSNARNAGESLVEVSVDYKGVERPQEGKWDIGALEYCPDCEKPAVPDGSAGDGPAGDAGMADAGSGDAADPGGSGDGSVDGGVKSDSSSSGGGAHSLDGSGCHLASSSVGSGSAVPVVLVLLLLAFCRRSRNGPSAARGRARGRHSAL